VSNLVGTEASGGEIEYLIKWEKKSHLHNSWCPKSEVDLLARIKLRNYRAKQGAGGYDDDDDAKDGVRHAWGECERVLSHKGGKGLKAEFYLCKWGELPYTDATWEQASMLLPKFQEAVDKYWAREKVASDRYAGLLRDKETPRKPHLFKPLQSDVYNPNWLGDGAGQLSLHPYQLEGLNWMRSSWYQDNNVILADEMGLGKTIQSSSYILSLFELEHVTRPFLIVVPLSTITNWERELALWAPKMHAVVYNGSGEARQIIRNYEFCTDPGEAKGKPGRTDSLRMGSSKRPYFDILLTSYEIANKDEAHLKKIDFEVLVVDEGHRLKNRESQLFKVLQSLKWRHGLLLTGTPLQNNLEELYNLMHFLAPKKFNSLDEYERILAGEGEDGGLEGEEKESMVSKLHEMLRPHMLRRMKTDVKLELPPKAELIIQCDLTPHQINLYRNILTKNYGALKSTTGGQVSLMNVVMELRKVCNHPLLCQREDLPPDHYNEMLIKSSGKLQLLDRMLDKLEEGGHRVLIFSQMTKMLDLLGERLQDREMRFERLDGSVSNAERSARIDRFNKNKDIFCFLLSTRAGGLGINLATADTVIIFDSDWNPHADTQALARAHRIGQQNKVMIYRLVTRNTVEERVMQRAKKKMMLEQIVVRKMKNDKASSTFKKGELDDILRYGASDMFSKEVEDGDDLQDSVIEYDDEALANLLDRTRDEVEDEAEQDSGWLTSFKVANYDLVKAEEQTGPKELISEMKVDDDVAEGVSTGDFWDSMIGSAYTEHMETLGKGKRDRRQVNPNLFQDLDDEAMDSEHEDDGKIDEEDNEATLTKKRKLAVESGIMDARGRILGFSTRERKTFKDAVMRHGLWRHTWEDFRSYPLLSHKALDDVAAYGNMFINHILEEQIEGAKPDDPYEDGVPREKLDSKDCLMRAGASWLVHMKLIECGSDVALFKIDDELKCSSVDKLYESSEGTYRPIHDLLLLQSFHRCGHASWKEMIIDPYVEPLIHAVYKASASMPRNSVNALSVQNLRSWPDKCAFSLAERRRKALVNEKLAKALPDESSTKRKVISLLSLPQAELRSKLIAMGVKLEKGDKDKMDMLVALEKSYLGGGITLPEDNLDADECSVEARKVRAKFDIGLLAMREVKRIFLEARVEMLLVESPKSEKSGLEAKANEDWSNLTEVELQLWIDRWTGRCNAREFAIFSTAVEDHLELGIWGTKEWRLSILKELKSNHVGIEKFGLVTSANGQLDYVYTEWMKEKELVWANGSHGWWPSEIVQDPSPPAPAPVIEKPIVIYKGETLADATVAAGSAVPVIVEDKEHVWVQYFVTGQKVKIKRHTSKILPFRTCYEKLSVGGPADPIQKGKWSMAVQKTLDTEAIKLQDDIDDTLKNREARLKDFVVDELAQRHLTVFFKNRMQTLREALLHEYLDRHPEVDVTPEEKSSMRSDDRFQLQECLQKVLESYSKELFTYIHDASDERKQGDLENLWHRLTHTEKGNLTARQVSSVLMQLIDMELVQKAVSHFTGVRNHPAFTANADGSVPLLMPEEVELEPEEGSDEWIRAQQEIQEAERQESHRDMMRKRQVEVERRTGTHAILTPFESSSCYARFSLRNHVSHLREQKYYTRMLKASLA